MPTPALRISVPAPVTEEAVMVLLAEMVRLKVAFSAIEIDAAAMVEVLSLLELSTKVPLSIVSEPLPELTSISPTKVTVPAEAIVRLLALA